MTLFLMIASTFATAAIQPVVNGTQLYVNPDYVQNSVGEAFTISVEISDVLQFYGFGIIFSWDPIILTYVSHTPMVPVEDHPGGVLHAPTIQVANTVDDVAGTYELAVSSLGAPPFDGGGKIFEITFEVLSEGSSALEIFESDLANEFGQPIEHEVTNGLFETPGGPVEVHDIAVTSCTPSPTTVEVGDPISISVTVENQGDFTENFELEVFYDGTLIDSTTDSLNTGNSDVYPFTWDTTGVTPGTYVISAEATITGTDDDPTDNTYIDGAVTISGIQPPPVDTVSVTVCPEFSSGEYTEWKHFIITNLGMEGIVKI